MRPKLAAPLRAAYVWCVMLGRVLLRPYVVPVVATLLLASGCGPGALPDEYPETGVDGLTIPTPSPDPDDFVVGVDNPWLPASPGTVWTYEVTGGEGDRLVVSVELEPREVAGVGTTVLHHELTDEGEVVESGDVYLAQDEVGNVWSFGAETEGPDGGISWEAGADGAEAGLFLPAEPREGDGWVPGEAPGVSDVLTVLATAAEIDLEAVPEETGLLVERTSTEPDDDTTSRTWSVEGVGPVLVTTGPSPLVRTELVEHSTG